MNKLVIRFSSLLVLFLLLQTGIAAAQSGNSSLYKWKTGTTAAYEVVQNQTQALEIPGQGAQESWTTSTTNMKLEATNPLEFKLNITDASVSGAPISVEPLIGLESNVVLEANGLIASASGLDGNAYIESNSGAEIFRESLQALFLVLPDEPLAAGVSWTRTINLPINRMGLELVRKVDETYTCKQKTQFEGKDAFEIELEMEVSMTGSGNQGGGDMDFSMEGKMMGTTYIEVGTGRLLSSTYEGSMAGVIDMAQGSLPMTIDLTTSAKLVE